MAAEDRSLDILVNTIVGPGHLANFLVAAKCCPSASRAHRQAAEAKGYLRGCLVSGGIISYKINRF